MTMDARKQRILEAIVAIYSTGGEPVGSGLLASHFDMALSSATLRNEMAALTKLGLLEQPHTSAGRVPSPKGYRYYLDHLLEAPAAIALSAADRENIDRLFADMDVEPEKLAQSAARALADYTGCAAVATTPQAEDLCIAHFVAPEDLTPSLTASLVLSAGRRLAPVVFAAEALVRTRPQFYLEGVQYLAKMPDVRTNLGALLEVFSDNEAARALIEPGSGKVTATLGEDIEPAMPNLCIVSKRYLAGGGLYGTVAVIGSNRMEYEHLIPVLNYFAIKLGQSMSGKKEEQT